MNKKISNNMKIISFLVMFLIKSVLTEEIPISFQACYNYIQSSFTQIFITKDITDPSLQQVINLSGKQWNDQGDIHACVVTPDLTFVEIEYQKSMFRGFCLNKVCNSDILQENRQYLQLLSNQFKLGINTSQIRLSGSNVEYPSKTNPVFIITIFFITLFLSLSAIASSRSLMKQIFQKKQKQINNDSNSTSIMSQYSHVKDKRESLGSRMLSQFDMFNNVRNLFTIKSSNDDLTIFNGIRVISFFQVIIFHELLLRLSYMQNIQDLPIINNCFTYLFVFSFLYSVDVFFTLGGFFVAYVVTDPKMIKNFLIKKPAKVACAYLNGILNRLLRILPCYFMAILIFWQIVPQLGDSPTWFRYLQMADNCYDCWWQKVLFIDNFISMKSKCLGWGWYLAADLQMYLFSMILVIIYANHKMAGKICIIFCILLFSGIGIWISIRDNLGVPVTIGVLVSPQGNYYYFKPWTRIPPYLWGLFFGILYKEYKTDKMNKSQFAFITRYAYKIGNTYWKYISYLIGLGIIFGLILIPRPVQLNPNAWPELFQNIWQGCMRLFYTIGISIITLPAICGSRDLIVKILSCKVFAFLARLSFCGYLIHFTLLSYTLWGMQDSVYLNIEGLLSLYFSEVILTLIVAFLLHIFVEQPIMGLTNILFSKQKKIPEKCTESSLTSDSRQITQPFLKDDFNSNISIDRSKCSETILYSQKPELHQLKEIQNNDNIK